MAKTPKPKGGWPKGKRRNADRGDWSEIRLGLTALFRDHHEIGLISAGVLARDLGVAGPRTVARWLDGSRRPDPETQGMIAAWLAEKRAIVARHKKGR